MVIGGLIHTIIIVGEDLFVWWSGVIGIPFWISLAIGLLIIYFFWKPLYAGIRFILKKIFRI